MCGVFVEAARQPGSPDVTTCACAVLYISSCHVPPVDATRGAGYMWAGSESEAAGLLHIRPNMTLCKWSPCTGLLALKQVSKHLRPPYIQQPSGPNNF